MTLSDLLGGLSIVTWLGAQSPQIYENYKNGSVEGLALPFLISWFWGDFTNFVGCVLTHQLPFQTYLATYFLFVDVALVSQYYHYSRRKPPQDLPPLSESFPYAQGSGPNHPPYIHPRKASKSRQTRRSRSSRSRSYAHPSAAAEDPLRSSFMSEHSARSAPTPNFPPHTRENSGATLLLPSNVSSTSLYTQTEPPSPTIPERGRTLARTAVPTTFDPTLSTIYGSPATESPYLIHTSQTRLPHHHVSFTPTALSEDLGHQAYPSRASSSRSRPPPPSRRATGIAFLSVGLLFTIGNYGSGAGVSGSLMKRTTNVGEAWSTGITKIEGRRDVGNESNSWIDGLRLNDLRLPSPSNSISRRSTYPLDVSIIDSTSRRQDQDEPGHDRDGNGDGSRDPPPQGTDWERVIGRTSAWLCTTLYLTSRLPQIWRNFRRRSVEGLAMTLFFFAFVGNSLYVASILTNPASIEPGYLVESLPYLLGSGGTLCFDLMIMFQSFLYSEKRKSRLEHQHRRKRNKLDGGFEEEEAALLRQDEETEEGEGEGGGRKSRSRDSSVGYGRSVSSRRTQRQLSSMTRSRSTELIGTVGRSLSRAERGILEDRQFDFDTQSRTHSQEQPQVAAFDRSRTPSGSTSSSAKSMIINDVIPEAGESSVTVRE